MYGLIHQAIRGSIIADHGDEGWERVFRKSGLDESAFVSMQAYDDEVSFGLVGAAVEALGLEVDDFLYRFGIYWVTRTAKEEYGAIMSLGGSTMREFLRNLDAMHEQVALTFTNLDQPSFRVEREEEDSVLISYQSSRDGLSKFVEGLLQGLAIHFGETVEVEVTARKSEGAACDEFLVKKAG